MTPSSPHPPEEDFFSTRQAADQLGVAVRTVQLWVESGVLRAWKTAGGHRRIARESLESLLANRKKALAPTSFSPASHELRKPASDPFSVLVVEDDPLQRDIYQTLLSSIGQPLEVRLAENGFAGLVALGERRPDLMITDLLMPGMNGFQMLAHLRNASSWKKLPIIAISALTPQQVAAEGGLPKGVELLNKPVDAGQLKTMVERFLDRRRKSAP